MYSSTTTAKNTCKRNLININMKDTKKLGEIIGDIFNGGEKISLKKIQ